MKLFATIFVLSIALFTSLPEASASGKITLQNNFFENGQKYRPMIGLGIYEPMFGGLVALNSWSGYGNQPFDFNPDANWMTTKNQLDFHIKRFTISPGFQWSYVLPYEEERSWVFLKVDYKLW